MDSNSLPSPSTTPKSKNSKDSSQEHRKVDKRFQAIFEASLDGIVITNQDDKIVDINPAGAHLVGLPKKMLLNKTLWEFVMLDSPEQAHALNDQLHRKGTLTGEVEVLLANGEILTVEFSAVADIQPGYDLIVVRDVSERKLEEQRSEHFLGIASHELRSPLASVKAMVQLSKKKLAAGETKVVGEYLDKVNGKVDTVVRFINDLLDVTRIRQGKLEFVIEEVDVDEFIAETVEEARLGMGDTHEVEVKGSTGAKIYADKGRLAQVVHNLIRNAVKYSPEANRVIVTRALSKGQVVVGVQDFGFGIKKDEQKKIFQLYYRSADERTEAVKGLGVGLFISERIVHALGGKMWVTSTLGEGATFYFSLPVSEE